MIGYEEGLPDRTVLCMLLDRQGFMWFGTFRGLARYDGYSFKVFQENVHDSLSLSGQIVRALTEDREGFIWVGTVGGGLNRFNPRTETFTHFKHDPRNLLSLNNNDVYAIHEDHLGRLWVGTRMGLDLFDASQACFVHVHPAKEETAQHESAQVIAIAEDPTKSGTLWIGTGGDGMIEIEPDKCIVRHIGKGVGNPKGLETLLRFIQGSHTTPNVLWVGTGGDGLYGFDLVQRRFATFHHDPSDARTIGHDEVRCMLQDRSGNLWIGTTGGLSRFDPTTGVFVNYRHKPNDNRSLCHDFVNSLLQDKSGIIWVGTGDGLCRFASLAEQFTVYQNDPNNPNSLSHNSLNSLFEDEHGLLWIASEKGLNCFDPKAERFSTFRHDPQNASSLRNDDVRTIYEDRKGDFWVGNTMGILHRFDRKTGRSRSIELGKRPGYESGITAMLDASDGTFWVGSNIGLFVVDRDQWKSRQVSLGPVRVDSRTEISSLYEDDANVLWIGTVGSQAKGLVSYDRMTGRITVYEHDPANEHSLGSNWVSYICSDKMGNLWVATIGGGLNRFSRAERTFTVFSQNTGVPDDVIGFIEDNRDNLWLATDQGICRLNPTTRSARVFSTHHGLPSNHISLRSFCLSKSGMAYFGGLNGMFSFIPDSIEDNAHIPPVILTNLKVFEKELSSDTSLSFLTDIALPYDRSFISLEFAALDFKDPRENRYAYKLEGLDPDWVNSGTRRYAAYTDLRPGRYTFRVKGSNDNGLWNQQGAVLAIAILPPWWKTTWAYVGYALSLVTILFFVRRYELNRLRLKDQAKIEHVEAEKLREVDRIKSSFFTNISHEFRTPLTLIEGPIRQLKSGEYQGDPNEIYDVVLRNAQRLLHLVNQLLDMSKLESGQVNLRVRERDVVDAVRTIAAWFESLAARKNIQFVVKTEESSIIGWIDRDALEKILVNLLSNAFKFTPKSGRVALSVGWNVILFNKAVEISVTDNGIGIPPELQKRIFDRFYQIDDTHTREHEGTGIGLALTKELVELHQGTITVQSEAGRGSLFMVRIPLDKSMYRADQIVESTDDQVAERLSGSAVRSSTETGAETIPIEVDEDESLPLVLIIEDNPDMRRYLRTNIEPGHRILEAADGDEGVKKAIEGIPDIVISDVMMPKMDGFEVCQRLKTDERTSHIPVILLTAKAGQEHKLEGLETGADDYLVKPFDAKELKARVRNLVEQRKRLHERFQCELIIQPKGVTVSSADEKFLKKVFEVVERNLGDSDFDLEAFAEEATMSRLQLHRKLKAITGSSPGEFVRQLRLQRAAELIRKRAGTISEIAYEVGFNNLSYFARQFREKYGVVPSEFLQSSNPSAE
jgi:signal transduction histidine kinase/ligand-binding sensor domain-containing protein/DNA-binding response OmpR family regulator